MLFDKALILALATIAVARPTSEQQLDKRVGILKKQPYAEFQVSDGVAGNALAEVQKKFPINEANIANIDAADLVIIKEASQTAEKAEVQAFNPAIAKATGDEKAELEHGKIKNKVLKLQLEVQALEADKAKSTKGLEAKLAEKKEQLAKSIALDKKAAGQKSKPVAFNG